MSQQNPFNISMVADDDLSSHQYKIVKPSANGKVDISGAAGEICMGILQNKPGADGEEARVAIPGGTSKLKVRPGQGNTIAVGNELQSNGSGYGVLASTDDYVMGIALEASTQASGSSDTFTLEVLSTLYEKNS